MGKFGVLALSLLLLARVCDGGIGRVAYVGGPGGMDCMPTGARRAHAARDSEAGGMGIGTVGFSGEVLRLRGGKRGKESQEHHAPTPHRPTHHPQESRTRPSNLISMPDCRDAQRRI